MANHPFNVVVMLFWVATMSWLVVGKVLPPLRVGEPPDYASILQEGSEDPPVCWSIRVGDRTIGWAASKIIRRSDGIASLHSRVYLGDFPWDEIIPTWLASVFKPVLNNLGEMHVDKKSRLEFDPLGRLAGFESRVCVGDIDAIKVQGHVEGSMLTLSVQSGEFQDRFERYLPPNALVSDELSPPALMPRLRVGQSWTVPMYSPFRASSNPIEILQAVVERQETLKWHGQTCDCRLIVYRADSGSGLTDNQARGRVWVRSDGMVLRQEVAILNSRLQFVRLNKDEAACLWQAVGEDLSGRLPVPAAKRLLRRIASESH